MLPFIFAICLTIATPTGDVHIETYPDLVWAEDQLQMSIDIPLLQDLPELPNLLEDSPAPEFEERLRPVPIEVTCGWCVVGGLCLINNRLTCCHSSVRGCMRCKTCIKVRPNGESSEN